jgi:aminoglycoside 6-adenylyltransferase
VNDKQQMFERMVKWGRDQESIRAIILTSTHAIPTGPVDVLSDYDPILVLTDIRPYFDDRTWLEDFGTVLATYRDPILLDGNLETSAYVTVYEDGPKIDFTLWPVALLQRVVTEAKLPTEFDAGYLVLLDKDGLTAGLVPPTYQGYIPNPPTEAEFLENVEVFFVDASYVAKYLWRDDLVAAKQVLDHFMKQEHIIPMLEWRCQIDHQWSISFGPYGRRLKKWLRHDLWLGLETTYTGTDIAANWTALFNSVAFFRRVSMEVGSLLGYPYPQDLHDRAIAYLKKIEKLDR